MTTNFTASNGITVALEPNRYGRDHMRLLSVNNSFSVSYDVDQLQALREFFQHERDEELGRWRDPECPDYFVTPREGEGLVVVHEATAKARFFLGRKVAQEASGPFAPTARRYFAAHPEKKPWHDAEPGEVWLLDIDGKADPEPALVTRAFLFETPEALRDLEDPAITRGRRLWPEPEEDQ